MRKMLLLAVVVLATFGVISYFKNRASVTVNSDGSSCDMSLWEHVYHGHYLTAQDRLEVLNPCLTVSGTIVNARPEADGDWHIQLDLDSEFSSLINQVNQQRQEGYLILEPICSNRVHQVDTRQEGVCEHFAQMIFSPDLIGAHVTATGAYVRDREHGWMELHPVTSIVATH